MSDATARTLTPSEAADMTGLSLDTLRYYEREGLIGPIDRSTGGTRRYTTDDVAWVGIVACLRDAGLGIDHLRRFTELLRTESGAEDRVAFLTRRREDLRAQQSAIEAALAVLEEKIAYWSD